MDKLQPVILSVCRTAIGNFLSGLSSFTAVQLGAVVIKESVKRAGIDPTTIDEVIMGQVVQAGVGQAPGRQAAVAAGIPVEVPAMTINKVCGSGLKAAMIAASEIKAGEGDCFVVGGMESMSNTPYVLHGAKGGLKFGDKKLQDSMVLDGLWDSFNNFHMGVAAELTVVKAGLTREEQDEFACNSHMKALAAIEAGKFEKEIVPVEILQRKGDPVIFDKDECPRPGTTVEKLARLRPAFQKDGSVTAGNSPGLNDGGAAMVVTSLGYAESNGLKPLAKITGYAAVGVDPKDIFFSPIYAVRKLMKKLDVDIDYFDLIEANEAFSAQALADGKELKWDWSRVNVHGGAVALGHPIGASGARVAVTLIYALQDRGLKTGLATLCLGGGNAVAMGIELM